MREAVASAIVAATAIPTLVEATTVPELLEAGRTEVDVPIKAVRLADISDEIVGQSDVVRSDSGKKTSSDDTEFNSAADMEVAGTCT